MLSAQVQKQQTIDTQSNKKISKMGSASGSIKSVSYDYEKVNALFDRS